MRVRGELSDSGSVVPFTVLLCIALTALLGLVFEGGAVLSARESAMAEVEQAARAGAATVSADSLHAGAIVDGGVEPAEVAEEVMAASGHPGSAVLRGRQLTATLDPYSIATPLLAIAGIRSMAVSASATAAAVAG